MVDFKSYLSSAAREIDSTLEGYFVEQINRSQKASSKLTHLTQKFAESCKGGKRIRGGLVKLGFELSSKEQNPEILVVAAAIEILQTGLLVHDDIIDLSETRRGKPTLYKTLGGDHYGISQAICLGDAAFFLSQELIADSNFPEDRKNKAIRFFINSMLKTVTGEMLDVEIPAQKSFPTKEDILTIMHLKTAHYTFIGPLQLGAVLGGANEELLEKLEEFGKNLGLAFQIQDDILGVFGTEQELGKSVTSDIEESKVTLLILKALENADQNQKDILEKLYGKGKISVHEHKQIKQVFINTGALDYSKEMELDYINVAKKLIPDLTSDRHMNELLLQMADFLIKRSK